MEISWNCLKKNDEIWLQSAKKNDDNIRETFSACDLYASVLNFFLFFLMVEIIIMMDGWMDGHQCFLFWNFQFSIYIKWIKRSHWIWLYSENVKMKNKNIFSIYYIPDYMFFFCMCKSKNSYETTEIKMKKKILCKHNVKIL